MGRPNRRWITPLACVILAAHLALLVFCAARTSGCYDEGAHLAAGCAGLKWHDFSIYDLSPPTLRIWAAIPAYLAGANVPPSRHVDDESPNSRHWIYFHAFQNANIHALAKYLFWGRLMVIPFSIAVGWMIFAITRRLFGGLAALTACAVWSFSPTVIAHGSTIGTDMGFTLGAFWATAAWIAFLRNGQRKRDLLLAACGMILAHWAKFSALYLWPMLILLAIWYGAIAPKGSTTISRYSKNIAAGLGVIAILTFVAMNSAYGFHLMGYRLGEFKFESQEMRSIAEHLPPSIPIPFSRDMIEGFDAQKWETDGKYMETLFNQSYFGTDWRYYPWLLLNKLTLGELVLLLLLAVSFFLKRPSLDEVPWIVLAIFSIGFIVFFVDWNNGIRYLLPGFPPMIILLGRTVRLPSLRWLAVAATIGLIAESIPSADCYHSFCNVLANRSGFSVPDRDWGQSLIALKRWMAANDQKQITVVNFGPLSPQAYNIETADPFGPLTTPYVAIGRRFMNGMVAKSQQSDFILIRPWRRLQQTPPVADLGGLVVYRASDVQLASEPKWIAAVPDLQSALHEPTLAPIRNLQNRLKDD